MQLLQIVRCCAASGRSSPQSLTGPRGRAAHSVTARGVICAGMLPQARLPLRLRNSPGRMVGPPNVTTQDVDCAGVQPAAGLPFRHSPGRGVERPQCHDTRCRLCRCASSCPSSLSSLTTVQVCILRPVFPFFTHYRVRSGRPQRYDCWCLASGQHPSCLSSCPAGVADTATNIPKGPSVRQLRPAAGPGGILLSVSRALH